VTWDIYLGLLPSTQHSTEQTNKHGEEKENISDYTNISLDTYNYIFSPKFFFLFLFLNKHITEGHKHVTFRESGSWPFPSEFHPRASHICCGQGGPCFF
jgi:hypothetical protein